MTGQEKIARGYRVSVRQPSPAADVYDVIYDPRTIQYVRGNGGPPVPVPPGFKALAHVGADGIVIRWETPPSDPEVTQEEFDRDVRGRVQTLHDWMGTLVQLIRSVETWGKELGWATRWTDKPLEDSQIGKYRAPCLLMQMDADRLLLEPVGRTAPGAEGVVDLYLMPAYDDIASLIRREGQWILHYLFPGMTGVTDPLKAPAKPLSKETLEEVLAEMRQHAA